MSKESEELELRERRKFACPSLGLIDKKGKEFNLEERTIEKAKNLTIEYFKKTHHMSTCASVTSLLSAFIYIASLLEGKIIRQKVIVEALGASQSSTKKWYDDIIYTLGIDMRRDRKIPMLDHETYTSYLYNIHKMGKNLYMKDKTIEKAKSLAIEYFGTVPRYDYYPYDKQLLPAFVYTASIIERDYRTKREFFKVSGVSEVVIDKWHNNILKTFGMRITGNGLHMTIVLDGEYKIKNK